MSCRLSTINFNTGTILESRRVWVPSGRNTLGHIYVNYRREQEISDAGTAGQGAVPKDRMPPGTHAIYGCDSRVRHVMKKVIEAPGAQVLRPTQCVPRRHARRPRSREARGRENNRPWIRASWQCPWRYISTAHGSPALLPEHKPDTVSLIHPSSIRRPFGARPKE